MKVTVENIKGLNKDLKVLIDKETMSSYMDKNMKRSKELLISKVLDQVKFQKKF